MFEKYFSGEQFTAEEILSGIKKGVKAGAITPVVCCSAFTLAGVDMVLDMICELMPSPKEADDEICMDSDGNPVELICADDQPLAAFVFKTIADPFVGKMSYVKVLSGKLTADQIPVNTTTGSRSGWVRLYLSREKNRRIPHRLVPGISALLRSWQEPIPVICCATRPVR